MCAGRARGAHRSRRGMHNRDPHERVRLDGRHDAPWSDRARQRPHQHDGRLAARGLALRRPHRPVLVPPAGGLPHDRRVAARRRLRRLLGTELRDARGDPRLPHSRWRSRRHVDGARSDRRARAAGLEVLGLSLVTNRAAGLGGPLNHEEVLEVGRASGTAPERCSPPSSSIRSSVRLVELDAVAGRVAEESLTSRAGHDVRVDPDLASRGGDRRDRRLEVVDAQRVVLDARPAWRRASPSSGSDGRRPGTTRRENRSRGGRSARSPSRPRRTAPRARAP